MYQLLSNWPSSRNTHSYWTLIKVSGVKRLFSLHEANKFWQ